MFFPTGVRPATIRRRSGNKAPVGAFFVCGARLQRRWRVMPTRPMRPEPNSHSAAGAGTGAVPAS